MVLIWDLITVLFIVLFEGWMKNEDCACELFGEYLRVEKKSKRPN